MKRTTMILASIAALSAAPLAAFAEANDTANGVAEAQMFLAAKLSLKQAGEIAVTELPGTLAAIGFNDEDARGVYEATVIGADGQASIVKLDADTGAVLGKGLASVMDDEEDGLNNEAGNDLGQSDEDTEDAEDNG